MKISQDVSAKPRTFSISIGWKGPILIAIVGICMNGFLAYSTYKHSHPNASATTVASPGRYSGAQSVQTTKTEGVQDLRPMNNGEKMAMMLLAWKKLGGNCEVMADDIISDSHSGNMREAVQRFLQVEPTCTAFVRQNGGY